MARCVRIFRAECRAKRINAAESLGVSLAVQLSTDRKACLLPEEILCVIHCAVLILRYIFHIQRSHAEHLAGPFAVTSCDQRGVYIDKSSLLEKLVDRICRQ